MSRLTLTPRRAALAALAAASLLLLAACGPRGSAPASDGSAVLRYSRWGLPQEVAAERELLKEFEAANPGVRVTLEYNAWSEYWNKLQAQMTAGSAPDVMLLGGEYAQDYAARGQLEDLSPRLAADPTIKLDYYKVCVDVYRFGGGLWALPRDCNTVGVFYNKTLFAKAGVEVPKPGWTWDDLLSKAKALTRDDDSDGRPDTFGYLAGFESMESQWGPFVWQNGGDVLDENHLHSRLAEPAAIEALRFYTGLVTKEKVSPDQAQASTFGSNMFLTGRLAMSAEGSWMMRSFSQAEGFEWDVAPLPVGKVAAAPVNGLGNAVYAKSKNKDAAWRLAKFLSSEPYQKKLAQSGTSIPALRSVAESPVYLDGKPSGKQALLDQIKIGRPLPFTKGFARWETEVRSQLELVWLGKKDVDTAMKDASAAVDKILAEQAASVPQTSSAPASGAPTKAEATTATTSSDSASSSSASPSSDSATSAPAGARP